MTRLLDLRLVPAAVAAWALAFILTAGSARTAMIVATMGCAGAVACSVPLVRGRTVGGARPYGQIVFILVTVCALGLTTAAHLRANSSDLANAAVGSQDIVDVRARVTSDPKPLPAGNFGEGERYLVTLTTTTIGVRAIGASQPAQVHLIAIDGSAWASARYGALVDVRGRLVNAERPGARERLRMVVLGAPREAQAPAGVLAPFASARKGLVGLTSQMSDQARGLVPGIGIGDTSAMTPELTEAMRVTGLTHMTAVSGSHFAIIAATVLAVLGALRTSRGVRIVVAGVAMGAFVVLVRPEPSVARAAVMGAFALAGMSIGRPSKALAALAGTMIGLLMADPWLARSVGFVLSVLATAALVLGAGPLTRTLAQWMPRPLALALAVPALAQAACGPVIVLLEPRIATYAVPANLLSIPALGPASICGVLAAALATAWPWGAGILATLASWATGWIAWIATFFAGLPGAQPAWPAGIGGAGLLAALTLVGVLSWISAPWWWAWARWGVQEARGRPGFLGGDR